MKSLVRGEISDLLGADRVLEPSGALPQPAERLDPSGPVRPHELEIAVERLCLDSTSHRNIRERSEGDGEAMAARVAEITAARGKMHNPETGSGGVLVGTVTAAGEGYENPPATGSRIVTLASLSLTPLALASVAPLDPGSAQVEVEGTAYLPERAPWGPLPEDMPLEVALAVYDVYGAGSHTREFAPQDGGTVCVLGTGHAGKLAMAAARERMGEAGTVAAVGVEPEAVARVRELGLCDVGVVADLRDPLGALAAVRAAGVEAAELTVNVVNAPGCEPASILLTADRGVVLMYSMATSFQTSALTADGMSADVLMVVGNGFAPDRGSYALDLVRRMPALRMALEEAA
jgi:L-erythro-3,5-diaminohexanoate dehydrogenase